MKMEKQSLKRRELPGRTEGMTFREMGQQVGNYFNAVKKMARGGTTNHEVFMTVICSVPARLSAAFAPDQSVQPCQSSKMGLITQANRISRDQTAASIS